MLNRSKVRLEVLSTTFTSNFEEAPQDHIRVCPLCIGLATVISSTIAWELRWLLFLVSQALNFVEIGPLKANFPSAADCMLKKTKLLLSLQNYIMETAEFAAMDKSIHPSSSWKVFIGSEHNILSQVCVRLFSIPLSNAAVERSFSTYNWIHTAKRNRLSSGKINNMLKFIVQGKVDESAAKVTLGSCGSQEINNFIDDETPIIDVDDSDCELVDEEN